MTDPKVPQVAVGAGRLGTAAGGSRPSAACPTCFLKVVWTFDMPVGVTDRSVLEDAVIATQDLVQPGLVEGLVLPTQGVHQ